MDVRQHTTLFHNARLAAADGVHAEGWLLVHDGTIERMGWGSAPPDSAGRRIDAQGAILAPGLVDLHVHGALGYDTMDATHESLEVMSRFYAQHGVTSFLAATMTDTPEAILAALANVADAMGKGTGGATLLGAHLEGPYLDLERRGCHDPSLVRPAEPAEYTSFFAAGVVRMITLAPEYAQSASLIRAARQAGIAVSAGHTGASYDEMGMAAQRGVTVVTHLFNGMEPMHHRVPGAVGAALRLRSLRCEIIADNLHVHPALLDLACRCKGIDGIILVTDAMRGTGMPDGTYSLGRLTVTVREGAARIEDGTLAGSTLTLDRAVCNMAMATGLSVVEALPMATRSPARALGVAHRKGKLATGMDADLILADDNMNVSLTMVGGRIVCQSSDKGSRG